MILAIQNVEEDSIENIYREQKEKNLPGLAAKTANICHDLYLQDCNKTLVSKKDYNSYWCLSLAKQGKSTLLAKGKCEQLLLEDLRKRSISL